MPRARVATPQNVDEIVARGRGLWKTIYTPHAEKLYNKLGAYHPDFIGACLTLLPRLATPCPTSKSRCSSVSCRACLIDGGPSRIAVLLEPIADPSSV